MKKSVSVIVPIFNAEKFLRRCVDSILSQTLKDIEIVLVDDGSTDNSPAICDEYEKSNENVKVLHQANGGLTYAWKQGVLAATGEYIGFVDADDYVESDMFQTLFDRAVYDGSEMVCCGIVHRYEGGIRSEWTEETFMDEEIVDRSLLVSKYYPVLISNGKFMGRTMMPCRFSRIVSRNLILSNMDLCSNEVSIGEDMQISLCMFCDVERISIVHNYYPYTYYMNNDSMTMVYDKNYMNKIAIMKSNLERISDVKNVYDFKQQILNDYLCLVVLNIKGCIFKQRSLLYKDIKSEIKRIMEYDGVNRCIEQNTLKRITVFEKAFLTMMKYRCYFLMYLCINIYFGK